MKHLYLVASSILLFATSVNAGILSVAKEAVGAVASSGSLWAGLGAVALIFLLKAIPNAKIQAAVGGLAYRLGRLATLGLDSNKWTKPFWSGIVEPYAIDMIDNTFVTFSKRLIEGLRSDNPVGK